MSFAISTQAELLKTKRTASFRLSVIGAALIPVILFLVYLFEPGEVMKELSAKPWNMHFLVGWQVMNSFLFPMYVILICALIPQIEYKNNTWKQLFSSPQSISTIFFSKFLTVHLMIFLFYVLFMIFMIIGGISANLLNQDFKFLKNSIDWGHLMKLNFKTYISILGISAIQFWFSVRFKNGIAPVAMGLGLLVGSIIAMNLNWEHIYKLPFAQPILTLKYMDQPNRPFLENHEINSIICFVIFSAIGFFDLKLRKEKG